MHFLREDKEEIVESRKITVQSSPLRASSSMRARTNSNPFFTNKRNIYDGVNELVAVVDSDKCTGCETCVSECPASAIAMENDKAKVDKDMCVDCQTCVDVCPSEAIHME